VADRRITCREAHDVRTDLIAFLEAVVPIASHGDNPMLSLRAYVAGLRSCIGAHEARRAQCHCAAPPAAAGASDGAHAELAARGRVGINISPRHGRTAMAGILDEYLTEERDTNG